MRSSSIMPRRAYTAGFKLTVCKYSDEFGNRAAGRHFKISESAVRRWRSSRAALEAMPKKKKAMRGSSARWPELEERLVGWVQEEKTFGRPVSTVALRLQAKNFAEEAGIKDFSASMTWAVRFIQRHNLPVSRRKRISRRPPDDGTRDDAIQEDEEGEDAVSVSQGSHDDDSLAYNEERLRIIFKEESGEEDFYGFVIPITC